jgi:hypothetical protein
VQTDFRLALVDTEAIGKDLESEIGGEFVGE